MTKLEREIKKYPHILALTVVRGEGSVYAEHKNRCLWKVSGKPMIQWVMEAAKGSKYIDKIAVITESEEIKKVLRKIGGITIIDRPLWTALTYPRNFTKGTFRRNKPRSLQSKEASIYTNPVDYSFYYLNKTEYYKPDLCFNIVANTPLVTSKILDRMVEAFFEDEEASLTIAITPIMPYIHTINPVTGRLFPLFNLLGLDKQSYPPIYREEGSQLSGLPAKENHTVPVNGRVGHIQILAEESADVHNKEDLFLAKCYMRRRLAREKGGDWDPDKDAA